VRTVLSALNVYGARDEMAIRKERLAQIWRETPRRLFLPPLLSARSPPLAWNSSDRRVRPLVLALKNGGDLLALMEFPDTDNGADSLQSPRTRASKAAILKDHCALQL
jgi:hypothetical protein